MDLIEGAAPQDAPLEAIPAGDDKAELMTPNSSESLQTETTAIDKDFGRENYPSLYDTIPTTFGAIILGVLIIAGIQWLVRKIFEKEKAEHKALTQFVTAMFALIAGLWVADKLIAGPDTELLLPGESTSVLTFIKDITLMVFSYYFGTKANVPPDDPPSAPPLSDEEGGV